MAGLPLTPSLSQGIGSQKNRGEEASSVPRLRIWWINQPEADKDGGKE